MWRCRCRGVVQSCVTCGVQYAMCQSTQKSIGDASEMHWKSAEFDMQGRTLTVHWQEKNDIFAQSLCETGQKESKREWNDDDMESIENGSSSSVRTEVAVVQGQFRMD